MERCDGWKLNSAGFRNIEKIVQHMLGNKYKNDVFLSAASKLLNALAQESVFSNRIGGRI